MGGSSESAKNEIIKRVKRSEDQLSDELLEGIPNDVTLTGIAAKLPWRAWQGAASLSPDWQRAFQDGMVYDARVVSQMTETFVVVLCEFAKDIYQCARKNYVRMQKRTLSLFSPNKEQWYNLPPIPGFPAGMPFNVHCQLTYLDTSIYLLGGTRSGKDLPSAEVLVLDLSVHPLEWRRCADMQIRRRQFHVGVMHGKIFVFGGLIHNIFECSNEVYDPKLDAWSWMAPLIQSGSTHTLYSVRRVYSVGQQFVCEAWPTPSPAELRPRVTDVDRLYDYCERLFVQDSPIGPWLLYESKPDGFSKDQMDGIHQMIEDHFIENVGRLPRSHCWYTPAKNLARSVESFDERPPDSNQFLWTYNPLKDDWRVFEKENLGRSKVDWAYQRTSSISQHYPLIGMPSCGLGCGQ